MSTPSELRSDLRYLEPDDLADILGVSRRVVMVMLRSGQIPAIKVGKSWRIPPSALAALDPTAQKRGAP